MQATITDDSGPKPFPIIENGKKVNTQTSFLPPISSVLWTCFFCNCLMDRVDRIIGLQIKVTEKKSNSSGFKLCSVQAHTYTTG